MSEYSYLLKDAWLQLGSEPPFNNVRIPTRGKDDDAEVQIDGEWVPFPFSGPRPAITEWRGQPVAGIASDWM